MHNDGTVVDTDKLNDVDALLLEECKKLHLLFVQYNRQLFLVGDMKNGISPETNKNGTIFFHVCPPTQSSEEISKNWHTYYWRINGFLDKITNGQLYIAQRQS